MSSTQAPAARALKRHASTNFAYSEAPRKQSRTDLGFGLSDQDRPQPPRAPRRDERARPGVTRAPSLRQLLETPSLMTKQPKQQQPKQLQRRVEMPSRRKQNDPLLELPGPVHDNAHIHATFSTAALNRPDPDALQSPKSTISNWGSRMDVDYEPAFERGHVGHQTLTRATISVEVGSLTEPIVGVGDGRNERESMNVAFTSLIYQLHNNGLLYAKANLTSSVIALSNGETINYDVATEFIDFYCRHFNFPPPVITTEVRSGTKGQWDSVMTIQGKNVGLGTARSRKASAQKCVLDVVRYLEKCDRALWEDFSNKSKTGEGLGDITPLPLFIPKTVRNAIQDLCVDLHHSKLYAANAAATLTVAPSPPPRRFSAPIDMQKKSQSLLTRRQAYLASPELATMRATRAALPVNGRQEDVLKIIADNDVVIFMAATGSGKTTQIPQILLDSWIEQGKGAQCNIFCTQPRRLAALGVATRVAAERGEQLGDSVGYSVRFDNRHPQDHGSITFCTIGVFLKKLQSAFSDPEGPISMDHITHILVDEVHERDVDTDLLLVILKRFLADRKARGIPIKVVLMSATIDGTLFRNYFPDDNKLPAPVIDIPGRSFPVEKLFLETIIPKIEGTADAWALKDPATQKYLLNESNVASAANTNDFEIPYPLVAATISHVLSASQEGHVLVFLPGLEEITKVQRLLVDTRWSTNFTDPTRYEIHVLHSTVPLETQQAIFTPPKPGIRRIILATNIAETSVTIPDVVYVVDSARLKEQRYDADRHLTSLVTAWVGTSNLNQRAGRAGRHRSGHYYGILTGEHANRLNTYQTVEMARADLTNVVMHVKAMNFGDMPVHDVLGATIEPPESHRIDLAMSQLRAYGAMDQDENLTAMGRVLLQIPIDVHLGRLLLYGSFLRCVDQAVTLAAIMANREPWLAPPQRRKEARAVKNSWTPNHFQSDPLTTLRAFNEWNKLQEDRRYQEAGAWAMNNFLSKTTLMGIARSRNQLLQSLGQAGVLSISGGSNGSYRVPPELNENHNSYPALVALIAVASTPKFAVPMSLMELRTKQDKRAIIHQASVNSMIGSSRGSRRNHPSPIVSFLEKRKLVADGSASSQTSLSNTTYLSPLTYILFGSQKQEVGPSAIRCDGWIVFNAPETLMDVLRLRQYLDRAMLRLFAGLALSKTVGRPYSARESETDDAEVKVQPLSMDERKELSLLSRDVVSILNADAEDRIAYMSRPRVT